MTQPFTANKMPNKKSAMPRMNKVPQVQVSDADRDLLIPSAVDETAIPV
jgi:hypothetical protein